MQRMLSMMGLSLSLLLGSSGFAQSQEKAAFYESEKLLKIVNDCRELEGCAEALKAANNIDIQAIVQLIGLQLHEQINEVNKKKHPNGANEYDHSACEVSLSGDEKWLSEKGTFATLKDPEMWMTKRTQLRGHRQYRRIVCEHLEHLNECLDCKEGCQPYGQCVRQKLSFGMNLFDLNSSEVIELADKTLKLELLPVCENIHVSTLREANEFFGCKDL